MTAWHQLNGEIVDCDRCPRLRAYCADVGREKRRAYLAEDYWAQPVPNFGAGRAGLLVVGLAPAAHGANRTGRMFTGDRSGQWLYRALHRGGFASQANSTNRHDGLELYDAAVTAICHCAPPDNKPTVAEQQACRTWLERTLAIVQPRVYLALGKIAWDGLWPELQRHFQLPGPRPRFAHGAELPLDGAHWLLASYHPSQQNTFTGRLTEAMLDEVMQRARAHLGVVEGPAPVAPRSSAAAPPRKK